MSLLRICTLPLFISAFTCQQNLFSITNELRARLRLRERLD